jgi:hypothetical protein
MNDELLIFEVEFDYEAKLSRMSCTMKTSQLVQGKENRDKVMDELRKLGFDPSSKIFTAQSAHEALARFRKTVTDFPFQIPRINS